MVRQCVSLGTVDGNSEPLQRQWASIWSHNAKRNGMDSLSANSVTQVCQVVACVNFDRDGFRVFRHTGVIAHPTDVGIIIRFLCSEQILPRSDVLDAEAPVR